MEIGVSTASLFGREYNEDAVVTLNSIDARVCEVFFNSIREYEDSFTDMLIKRKGNLKVHSIHTFTTMFEPQLFSYHSRAYEDAYMFFENALKAGAKIGATNYTLHGIARFKKNKNYDDYETFGTNFKLAKDFAKKFGIDLCLENVEWSSYNKPGFLTGISEYCKDIKTCLDIKQARISGYSYIDYLNEMGTNINTVHLSDINENGKMCLPGKGTFDFKELFKRLKDVNFSGNMLIEAYKEDYKEYAEIKESLDYLRNIKEQVF